MPANGFWCGTWLRWSGSTWGSPAAAAGRAGAQPDSLADPKNERLAQLVEMMDDRDTGGALLKRLDDDGSAFERQDPELDEDLLIGSIWDSNSGSYLNMCFFDAWRTLWMEAVRSDCSRVHSPPASGPS